MKTKPELLEKKKRSKYMKFVFSLRILLLALVLSWSNDIIAQLPDKIEKEANKLFKNE